MSNLSVDLFRGHKWRPSEGLARIVICFELHTRTHSSTFFNILIHLIACIAAFLIHPRVVSHKSRLILPPRWTIRHFAELIFFGWPYSWCSVLIIIPGKWPLPSWSNYPLCFIPCASGLSVGPTLRVQCHSAPWCRQLHGHCCQRLWRPSIGHLFCPLFVLRTK